VCEQLSSPRDIAGARAAGQQPVVADAVESGRQDVDEEAVDELAGGERHELLASLGPVILPLEGDAVAVTGDQPAVGFADIANLRYSYDYSEQLGYLGVQFNSLKFGQLGTEITPFTKLFIGFDHETSSYGGTTAAGTLDFNYNNKIDTWRYGAEFGAHIKQPLSGWYGLYFDAAARLIEDVASADSTVTFSGAVNAAEGKSVTVNKLNAVVVVGGGIYAQAGHATFRAGAAFESWAIPNLEYSNTAPVTLDYKARDSISGTLTFKYSF
jgi:hypothetical protein